MGYPQVKYNELFGRQNMDLSLILSGATLLLNAIVVGFWKPWLSAYGGEKAKNFARKEDLDLILAEVRAVTITQKEIELKLSGDLWQRQMQWNETRTVYGNLIAVLHKLQVTCNAMIVSAGLMLNEQLSAQERAKVRPKLNASVAAYTTLEQELMGLTALAEIFASSECRQLLSNFLSMPRDPEYFESPEQLWTLMDRLITLGVKVLQFAKRDLGISNNIEPIP